MRNVGALHDSERLLILLCLCLACASEAFENKKLFIFLIIDEIHAVDLLLELAFFALLFVEEDLFLITISIVCDSLVSTSLVLQHFGLAPKATFTAQAALETQVSRDEF